MPRPSVHIERDLPPVPPIPPSVYEMGLASPRGLTRSNSRSSMRSTRTTASAKSRKQIIQQGRRPTISTPSDFRKVEGAMPHTNVAGFRGNETGDASPRPSTASGSPFSLLELSIHRGGGKLSPMPSFSRPTPRKSKTLEHRPLRASSLVVSNPHRRSLSAPISVRSSPAQTIPRKPVMSKSRISTPGPILRSLSSKMKDEEFSMKIAIEAENDSDDNSLFEEDSKPRTQSYYADAGAALLASTLDVKAPAPLQISRTRSSSIISPISPSSRKSYILPEAVLVSSPVPIGVKTSPKPDVRLTPTPHIISPAKKVTRSKSVGPFPMPPSRSRSSSKRRSLEVALPQLPRSVYVPTPTTASSQSVPGQIGSFSTVRPRSYSLAKTATTAPSSKRSSAASEASLLSSDTRTSYSSLASPSIAANPTLTHLRRERAKDRDRDSDKYIAIPFTLPEAPSVIELPLAHSPAVALSGTFSSSSSLSPPTFRSVRRSTQAPIPVTPTLPNSTFTVPNEVLKSPKSKTQGRRQPISRSTSTENIRGRRTQRETAHEGGEKLKRSKSYYEPGVGLGLGVMGWEENMKVQPVGVRTVKMKDGATRVAVEKEVEPIFGPEEQIRLEKIKEARAKKAEKVLKA